MKSLLPKPSFCNGCWQRSLGSLLQCQAAHTPCRRFPTKLTFPSLPFRRRPAIQTDLRVEVEDNESSEACEGKPRLRFRFSTSRADKQLLGHVMSGTIQDLKRLQEAIHAFDRMLREETNPLNPDGTAKPPLDFTNKNYAWTWFDYWIFDSVFSTITAKFKGLRSQTGSQPRGCGEEAGNAARRATKCCAQIRAQKRANQVARSVHHTTLGKGPFSWSS